MSEQNSAPVVEEVATEAAAQVQPEKAPVEKTAVSTNNNNAQADDESEQKPTDESKAKESKAEVPVPEKSADSETAKPEAENKNEQPATGEPDMERKKTTEADETSAAAVGETDEKPAEVVGDKATPAVDANGESKETGAPVTEPAAEETNGVCKRKAENGAAVVEDEKSPKKAKIVDEGDKATVEETAA